MNREELLALAERVEGTSGPSYQLECDIWDVIYPGERDERFRQLCSDTPYKGRLGPADKDGYIKPLRAFTASLDAAMTLVPEGWRVRDLSDWTGEDGTGGGWSVDLIKPPASDRTQVNGDAATPALALTAASLRAHATNQEKGR